MSELTETVTITRKVDSRIADLVYFLKFMFDKSSMIAHDDFTDEQLINYAKEFWDIQHGE